MPNLEDALEEAKAKQLSKLKVLVKKVDADKEVPVKEEEPEPVKEDDVDGFEIRQLLVNLDGFCKPGKYDGKEKIKLSCDEKLLNCIKRVKEMTAQRRTSAKLQSFLCDWLKGAPEQPEELAFNEEAFVRSRTDFFHAFRAETRKWQGEGSIPDSFKVSDTPGSPSLASESQLHAASVAASKLFPAKDKNELWDQYSKRSRRMDGTMVACRGSRPTTGAFSSAFSTCSDWCTSPPSTTATGLYSTMGDFHAEMNTTCGTCSGVSMTKSSSVPDCLPSFLTSVSPAEKLAMAVGPSKLLRKMPAPEMVTSSPVPGFFEMNGKRRRYHRGRSEVLESLPPVSPSSSSGSRPSKGWADDVCQEPRHHVCHLPAYDPLSDNCRLCLSRSGDHHAEDPAENTRRVDIGRDRMKKPKPGGAAGEHAAMMRNSRMRLHRPMLTPAELKTSIEFAKVLHPYGRAALENICAPFQKCDFMPSLTTSTSESPFTYKEPPMGGEPDKSFKGLFNDKPSAKTVQHSQWRYFKECERKNMIPRMPTFLMNMPAWRHDGGVPLPAARPMNASSPAPGPPLLVSVARQNMKDPDLETFVLPLKGSVDADNVRVNLSHNMFSDSALAKFVEQFPTKNITALNLIHSGAATKTVDVCANCIADKWACLQVLQLGGHSLADKTWEQLCYACINYANITRLDLVEMSLGRSTQDSVVRVADVVSSAPVIEHLDLSGNFIFYEGFEALAKAIPKTKKLKLLDLSYNAAVQGVKSKRTRPYVEKAGETQKDWPPTVFRDDNDQLQEEMPVYHPAAVLAEAMQHNHSIEDLRMAGANIDFTVDCCLLLALSNNTTCKTVDLSDNPHGEDGLRALLRLVVTPGLVLEEVLINDVRPNCLGPGVKQIEFGAPGGKYDLDFQHPQNRAICKWMLRVAEYSAGLKEPAAAFAVKEWTGTHGPTGKNAQWCWRSNATKQMEVQKSGRIQFHLKLDLVDEDLPGDQALKKYQRIRRVPVTLGRFVPLMNMFDSLKVLGQKESFLKALSETCLVKVCHLMKFAQSAREVADHTVPLLYPHLLDQDILLLFDLQGLHRHLGAHFRKQARSLFFFNARVPTNSYVLHLVNPMDRAVAEQLFVINYYDKEVSMAKKVVDTSRYGNYEGARNLRFEGKTFKSLFNFHIPTDGALSLDYVSPIHCYPNRKKKGTEVTCDDMYNDLVDALLNSPCSVEDKVSALRLIAHHLTFTPKQVHDLMMMFPSPSAKVVGQYDPNKAPELPTSPVSATFPSMPGMQMDGYLLSAFQNHVDNGRAEVFILFFTRCVDWGDLCNYQNLWCPEVFSLNNAKKIRERLGFMRTVDIMNLGRPYGIPEKERILKWEMWMVNEAVNKARNAEKEGTMKEGVAVEGCKTVIYEAGRRYILHLPTYEEHCVGKFLMAISDKELKDPTFPPTVRCDWTCRSSAMEGDYDFYVPGSWKEESGLPTKGTFLCTYMNDCEENLRKDKRSELAHKFLGWVTPSTVVFDKHE